MEGKGRSNYDVSSAAADGSACVQRVRPTNGNNGAVCTTLASTLVQPILATDSLFSCDERDAQQTFLVTRMSAVNEGRYRKELHRAELLQIAKTEDSGHVQYR
jgi:hypothetical protein